MKKLLFTFAMLFGFLFSYADGELEATTPELQSSDMSFVQEKQKDGRLSGGTLIKVRSGISNLQFYGWVIKAEQRRPGEYWVFLETAGGKLQVAAERYAPVDIEITDETPEMVYMVTVKGGADANAPTFDYVHIDLPAIGNQTHPGFDMALVKSGRFIMGATPEQHSDEGDEKPAHRVLISHDYYIGETEVTQSLWEYVMGNNPSTIKDKSIELPVENISWEEAHDFCNMLNRLTGKKFRLPTEAEWEYAARGGHASKGTTYSGSNDPKAVGWHADNSNLRPHAVKTLAPNELGIYDMSGNVYELCEDSKENYKDKGEVRDPLVDKGVNSERVRRGGSWDAQGDCMRCAYRRRVPVKNGMHPGAGDTGLRLVMEVTE